MTSYFERVWTPVAQLPHIKFPPDGDLVLGTLLKDPKDPRRALSEEPLVDVPKDAITEDPASQPWDWNSNEHRSIVAKLWASISAGIPGLSIGLGGSGSSSSSGNVRFHSDGVKARWFSPDQVYLKALVDHATVSSYGNKQHHMGNTGKPPIYLVVGLLVATNGTFHIDMGKERVYKTNVEAKAMDVAGGGVEGEYSKGWDTSHSASTSSPFILAYQLIQIKISKDGSYKEKDFNGLALFDDENKEQDVWEITPCTLDSIFT